jgi:predicted transcriptional regulator
MGQGIVRDIREKFDDPKPARNTVSTVVRVLEKKGFIGHKAYGNVHVYYPLVSKEEYSGSQLFGLLENYFDNSFPALASFFVRKKDLSITDLEDILEDAKKEMKKTKKRK